MQHYIKQHSASVLDCFEEISDLFEKHIGVFNPDSNFIICWNLILLFFILINSFYLPMKISFEIGKEMSKLNLMILEFIPTWVFIL